MSTLGSHDVPPDGHEQQDRHTSPIVPRCIVCGESAHVQCECCGAHLCRHHLVVCPRYRWETLTSVGTQFTAGSTWTRYLPAGQWSGYPSCVEALAAENARELARDRRERWHERILFGALFKLAVS